MCMKLDSILRPSYNNNKIIHLILSVLFLRFNNKFAINRTVYICYVIVFWRKSFQNQVPVLTVIAKY